MGQRGYHDSERGRFYLGSQPLRRSPPAPPPGFEYGLVRTGALDDGDDAPIQRVPRVRAVLETDDDVRRGGILICIRPEIPSRALALGERALALSERAAASARWIAGGTLAIILAIIAAATYLWSRRRQRRVAADD